MNFRKTLRPLVDLTRNTLWPLFISPPDLLIIGAQKAGTTSLYRYLIQHPQILGNELQRKEIYYFSKNENYARGFGWYLNHFPNKLKKGSRITIDATPSYIRDHDAPKRIKNDLGNVKMILLLRDPTERAYSDWKMFYRFGLSQNAPKLLLEMCDRRSFPEAIEYELNGKGSRGTLNYHYIQSGLYAQQLENYFNYFKRECFLILDFRDLNKDLIATLNAVCNFLNIDPFSDEKLQKIQGKIHNRGIELKVTPEVKNVLDRLKAYYKPHNQRLYKLIGHDYEW